MSKMYVMIGCAGAGKSTFIKQHAQFYEMVISRDKIREQIAKEGEPYFSREKEVYQEFIAQINAAIKNNKDFYVDQTSLNPASRNKLFNHLKKRPDQIVAIYIKKPLEVILKQNALRIGRAFVPEDAVKQMYESLVPPQKEEGFDEIWTIE